VVGAAAAPLNFTVLVPCVAPKFVPVIVIDAPTAPEVGDRPLMTGEGITAKLLPALAAPPTVTTTFPVVTPAGTEVTTLVALQLVGVAAVPLKLTVLVPCVTPKFVPVIVIEAPTAPEVGDRLVMLGAVTTVKVIPLLSTLLACTTTFPVAAPVGTGATMLVALQLVGVAVVPLNLTVLVPCVTPKFVPVIVTDDPTVPLVWLKLVMDGVERTVKLTVLLLTPLAKTTTFPVVATVGTGTTILVALQLVGVAVVPLNFTVPVPCVGPKFAPVIVTEVLIAPDVGDKLVILGAGTTVNERPSLAIPPTVTITFPVVAPVGTVATMLVALQLVTVAVVPLNFTVLVPWVPPRFVPVIVTDAPTAPEVGDRLAIVGAVPVPPAFNATSTAAQ
jgi:hypothetical protein